MRGMPEASGDPQHPTADAGSPSFRIGGHDRQNKTSWKHVQTKAQTGTRALDVNQARSGSSETRSWLAGLFPADGPAPRARPYQKARRLAWEELASCFGRVCKSPQNSTAATTANIATTQTVTRKESVGMRLISGDEGSMPARLDRGHDLDQTRRHSGGVSHAAAISHAAAMAAARLASSSRTPPATMMSIFSRSNRVSVRLTVSIVSPR